MSDAEKKTSKPPTEKSERGDKLPSQQLAPPSDDRSARGTSPVRLSAELILKAQTQLSRITLMKDIAESLPTTHKETSLEELSQVQDHLHLEELHKAFAKEHAYFKVAWPAALIQHDYFNKNAHGQESRHYMAARRAFGQLRHIITEERDAHLPRDSATQGEQEHESSRLPDITLPTFKGEYAEWPAFRDLFSSIILESKRLSNVEKMHYLRSSLEGAPAQLILGFSLCGDNLSSSWSALVDRYDNKRLLIHTQLDNIFASCIGDSTD